ncbi:DNA methylase [Gemmatimonadetes bacterium T265]|nr:DNA methylase [Gemmatimonadetes bacterium T265]
MRLAVLADVHGNLRALEAVLADLARHAPDLVVNLGDCVSGPLAAADTADLMMGLAGPAFVTVRGNHDRQLLDCPAAEMGPSDRAADAQLTARHRAWLAALPAAATASDGADAVLCCHGAPASDLTYLLETVGPHGVALARPAEVAARLGATTQALVLCGHTHVARAVALPDGRLVVNPGSVGLPAFDDAAPFPHVIEAGSPHARYAVLDVGGGGRLPSVPARARVQFAAVAYDWDAAAADARRAGRPDWAWALATGYAADAAPGPAPAHAASRTAAA